MHVYHIIPFSVVITHQFRNKMVIKVLQCLNSSDPSFLLAIFWSSTIIALYHLSRQGLVVDVVVPMIALLLSGGRAIL